MKLAFYADRHISMRSPRFDYALSIWDWVIDDAITQGATAFIGLGDVCEGDPNGAERMALGLRYQRMLKHAPVAEVMGNHETRDGLAWLGLLGVVVAWDQIIPLQGDVVDVLLAPYARKGHAPYDNLGEGLSMAEASLAAAARLEAAIRDAKRPHRPLIVAGHWTPAGTRMGETDVEIHSTSEMIVPIEALASADLTVTGHIHTAQDYVPGIGWGLNGGESDTPTGTVVVAGSLYRCSFGEAAEAKSYVLVTVDRKGHVSWERRPVPARKMAQVTANWPLDSATSRGLGLLEEDARAEALEIKVVVKVPEDQLATFDSMAFEGLRQQAALFVLDRQTVSIERVRAPAIAAATTPATQLHAWLDAIAYEGGEADRATLAAMLTEVTS